MIPKIKIERLKIEEPFKSLYSINYETLEAIKRDIEENGFDESQLITMWKGKNIVIDGHTRLQAAKDLGLTSIPVQIRSFADENDAVEFAIHRQTDRRNLSDGDVLHLVEKLDVLLPRGGDRKSNFGSPKIEVSRKRLTPRQRRMRRYAEMTEDSSNDSRDRTAELIGISTDKVSKCRHVLKNLQRREIDEITQGYVSLNQAYQRSLLANKNEKKKWEQSEKNRQILIELGKTGFPTGKQYGKNVAKLDKLIFALLPRLYKREEEMYKIMQTVKDFQSQGKNVFNIFCSKEPVQQFLGHLFTTDFITILQCFGYKIEKPEDLKIIEQKRIPKVDGRIGKKPKFDIERVHQIGFVSKRERKERDAIIERAVMRDLGIKK